METELKKEREAFGLTQAEFARLLGLTTNGYARIERGERSLTGVHKASLNMLYFISANDLLVKLFFCVEKGFEHGK